MKIQKEKVGNHIAVLLDEAHKPGAVMDLDGNILYVNDLFLEEMDMNPTQNFKENICDHSIQQWNSLKNRVNRADYVEIDMNVRRVYDRMTPSKVKFIYLEEQQQVIAIFDNAIKKGDTAAKMYLHSFQTANSFMMVVDENGIIIDVNNKHADFFNLPKEYFCGEPINVLFHLFSEQQHTLNHYMNKVNLDGIAEIWQRFERSPEDVRHYHITTFINRETGMYLIRLTDRTEKVILEERLAHTDSLSTVGELAASIAHEIRNPMTTMKGFIQLLRISSPEDSLKYLSVIDSEIERMESILTEMLILSKPSTDKKMNFSLEVVVDDMIQIVYAKALMDGITIIQKENGLKETLIFGDAYKVKQAILNLIKNAFEAIDTRGIVTIGVEVDELDQIVLTITDNGKGMSLAQVNQMYLPFFSSKEEGTGLGLPFVIKTVEDHGGTISVQSEVGVGTTFTLTFPPAIKEVGELVAMNKVVS